MATERRTVALDAYPDLVLALLGMRVNVWTGIRTLLGIGPKIESAVGGAPSGLLSHELFLYSLVPPHIGIRQYWRDFDSLETWSRSEPHRTWWSRFVRDTGGTGFWHELYGMRGGVEAIYVDIPATKTPGLGRFAPLAQATGTMSSSRGRLEAARHAQGEVAAHKD